ncbi:MAG: response regulator [Nitrospirae bacterium]|nr:response regulator [Candidatus Manganitrophaceae bacterium]
MTLYNPHMEADIGSAIPKILAVDDNADTVTILSSILERAGYAVISARSGAEAIELAERELPALVLLDLILPDRNGLDILEAIKKIAPLKNVPILVVSAMSDKYSKERSYSLGVREYLTKPIYPSDLLNRVREHLPRGNKAAC